MYLFSPGTVIVPGNTKYLLLRAWSWSSEDELIRCGVIWVENNFFHIL